MAAHLEDNGEARSQEKGRSNKTIEERKPEEKWRGPMGFGQVGIDYVGFDHQNQRETAEQVNETMSRRGRTGLVGD